MISVKNLNKNFKEYEALKNINLEISTGECAIIKGESGSGKSTLLSIISALSHPSSGEVVVNGLNIAKLPDQHASKFRSSHIGLISQTFNLIEALSVKDNLLAAASISNADEKDIEKGMKVAHIFHKKDEYVFNLSGGEKQRCAIARALVNSPEIIIADEPTASLDVENSIKFIETIIELKKSSKTIIISTHDTLFDKYDIFDKRFHMRDGELQYEPFSID
ncbi:MAG: ABC transporter ATP-binding protein [Campylobacterota bacterium]|nr:ABC transporter ATP-binding protein [Campylobacterota bacterium]